MPLNSLLSSAALFLFHCPSKTNIFLCCITAVFHWTVLWAYHHINVTASPIHSRSKCLLLARLIFDQQAFFFLKKERKGKKTDFKWIWAFSVTPHSTPSYVLFKSSRTEHRQMRAFFGPLSFSLSLTLKFCPHGEGFALSSGICIYDENNCLSEIRCFLWGKRDSFFFSGWQKKKKQISINNLTPSFPLLWWSSFRFSPMVFLYLSTVIPSIWFLELSLLQSKLPFNNSSGHELHLLAHIPISAVGVPPTKLPCLPEPSTQPH